MRVFERLRENWHRSMQRRQTLNELAACPPDELNRIAADVGLSGKQLREHCRRDHGATDLLPQRLQLLGIDPAPTLFRDLARVCAACRDSRRCAGDLAKGDVQAGMSSYCPNGPSIDLLSVSRGDALATAERGG